MRPGFDEKSSVLNKERRRDLLVLGTQGTLIPDSRRFGLVLDGVDLNAGAAESLLEPWMCAAAREIDLRVPAEHRTCGGEPIDLAALFEGLGERLRGMLTQVLAAYPDTTPERLAREFPLLSSLLKNAVAEWVDATAIFLTRLHADAARLAGWLGYEKLPGLLSLTPTGSDSHAGGHKVLRLSFRDGPCMYYKPRSVTGEGLWDGLMKAVHAHSSLQLTSASTLNGSPASYGWVRSLAPHTQVLRWDGNSVEARAYWHAAGATLCLAEHVRMTDLHMANVMATACGPALFDAESLGSPRFAVVDALANQGAGAALARVMGDLEDTLLLPNRDREGLADTSGFFGRSAAVPEILIPRWSPCADGRQRLEMMPAALAEHGNAPPGATAVEVLPLLVSGYREAAAALMRCRDSLIAPHSAWRRTLEHSHAPRMVLRDTFAYGILLSRSLEPEQLRSPEARRLAVQRALRGGTRRPFPDAVLRTEMRTLLQLHVPRFTALPGSRTLGSSSGRALAPRLLECTPAESVLRKLQELSPERVDEIHVPALCLAVLGGRG